MENQFEKPNRKAYLVPPGYGGHEDDYTLHLEGYDINGLSIPDDIIEEFKKFLGDEWLVDNRGTRIEFIRKNDNKRDDARVIEAIEAVLGPCGFDLDL